MQTKSQMFFNWLAIGFLIGGIGLTIWIHEKMVDLRFEVVRNNATIAVLQSSLEKKIAKKVNRLNEWVYRHSSVISKKTVDEIVSASSSTKYPVFLLAIMELESVGFRPSAVSPTGAVGLGQINVKEHGARLKKAGVILEARDLFNIKENIQAADLILHDCMVRSKADPLKALECYLGGKDGRYVLRILKNYAEMSLLLEAK